MNICTEEEVQNLVRKKIKNSHTSKGLFWKIIVTRRLIWGFLISWAILVLHSRLLTYFYEDTEYNKDYQFCFSWGFQIFRVLQLVTDFPSGDKSFNGRIRVSVRTRRSIMGRAARESTTVLWPVISFSTRSLKGKFASISEVEFFDGRISLFFWTFLLTRNSRHARGFQPVGKVAKFNNGK